MEEERTKLTHAALQVCAEFAAGSARSDVAEPDAFRFRFDIDDGSQLVSLENVDLPASAAMRVLSDWAQEESTRIVLHVRS